MTDPARLHAWLADRERQRRTQSAVDAFGSQWGRTRPHLNFEQALANLADESAESLAEAITVLFVDDCWVQTLIDRLADQLRADPFFEPSFRAINSDIHRGLIAFEDPRVSIAAGVSSVTQLAAKKSGKRGATSVGFTGRMTVLKFVKAGDALLSLWEAPLITAGFNAAEAGHCRRTGERRLTDGEILIIDGRRQGYVIEHARTDLLLLQAEINCDQAPVGVEYDSASLAYVGCSANGDCASRIQMITTLLRKLDAPGAFDSVAAFLDHPDFFVRWHVMRELLGIDAEAAMPHLARMAEADPHPDARRAARAVLDRIVAPPAQRAA